MTNDATNPVEVAQADIDAAQAIYETSPLLAQGRVKARRGHELVQAFARHRIASRATDKKLAEALRPFAAEADNYDCVDDEGNFVPDYNDAPDESALNEINDLTVGDLRRARRILTSLEGQG